MRGFILAASLALAASPALAQQGNLTTTVTGGSGRPSATMRSTPAPVPAIPPRTPDSSAPSAVPEVVSPAGGDAPSGPADATPYSAGPSGAGIAPTIGGLPDNPGYAGTVPGQDPTSSK